MVIMLSVYVWTATTVFCCCSICSMSSVIYLLTLSRSQRIKITFWIVRMHKLVCIFIAGVRIMVYIWNVHMPNTVGLLRAIQWNRACADSDHSVQPRVHIFLSVVKVFITQWICKRTARALIRLRMSAAWSVPLLSATSSRAYFHLVWFNGCFIIKC